MKYVITDLDSPWCVWPTEISATEEEARAVHERQTHKSQHGYVPDELAEVLQRAWDALMAVNRTVEEYRKNTGQGDGA